MIMSRIWLDTGKRDTRAALMRPSRFHGAVENSYEGERKRVLWRIDRLEGRPILLLVSPFPLDLASIHRQFGDERRPPETHSYDGFLDRIGDGDTWRFRLTANPTRACIPADSRERNVRGKVRSENSAAARKKWLMDRAEKNGFTLDEDEFEVLSSEWISMEGHRGGHVRFLSVTYEGVLHVKDRGMFTGMLANGIGREKAFGQGLMTIVGKAG